MSYCLILHLPGNADCALVCPADRPVEQIAVLQTALFAATNGGTNTSQRYVRETEHAYLHGLGNAAPGLLANTADLALPS